MKSKKNKNKDDGQQGITEMSERRHLQQNDPHNSRSVTPEVHQGQQQGPPPTHFVHSDEDEYYGEKLPFDPNFSGPVAIRKRKFTDCFCLILFLVVLGCWGFVAFVAFTKGDIDKIIYPTDSQGRICGRGEFKERKFLLFFDLTKCLNPAIVALGCPTPQVCVSKCPGISYSGYADSRSRVQFPSSIISGVNVDEEIKNKLKPFCLPDIAKDENPEWRRKSALQLIDEGICPPWLLPSNPVLGRCLPLVISSTKSSSNASTPSSNGETLSTRSHISFFGLGGDESDSETTIIAENENPDRRKVSKVTLEKAISSLGAFLQLRTFGERVIADLAESWWIVLSAFVLTAVVSFIWIVSMRFLTGFMIWLSIAAVLASLGGLFAFSLLKYLVVKDLPSAQGNIFMVNFTPDYAKDVLSLGQTWLAFSILLGLIFFILLVILIAVRTRVLIAIELIEQAAGAVGHQWTTLLFPLFPTILHFVVLLLFTFIAAGLASAESEPTYRIEYQIDEQQLRSFVRFSDESNPSFNDTFGVRSGVSSVLSSSSPVIFGDDEDITESGGLQVSLKRAPAAPTCVNDTDGTTLRSSLDEQIRRCVNRKTGNKTYHIGDVCDPKQFKVDCEACLDKIRCIFTRYESGSSFLTEIWWMRWFNIFVFLWCVAFVSALTELILASVFCKWYWCVDKRKLPCCLLLTSSIQTFIFHLGTLAFGSLIIAIITFIRTVINWVQERVKKFDNDVSRCIFCMCKCCCWCLEKVMRYINRNAYIMTAMNSTSFFTSAKDAFNLLMRNILRVVVLNSVVTILLTIGQITIVIGMGCLVYFVLLTYSHASSNDNTDSGLIDNSDNVTGTGYVNIAGIFTVPDTIPTLNYNLAPVVASVVGAYFITGSFFKVYNMAVDTIFLCFLEDLERNDGTRERPYFMSKGMQKILGKMQKFRLDND